MRIHINTEDYEKIDNASYRFTYELRSVKDPAKSDEKVIDMQVLDIGTNVSKYYSWNVYQHALKVAEMVKQGARSIPNASDQGAYGYEVFKNHPKAGTMTVTDVGYMIRPTAYVYDEPMPRFHWELHDEQKEILGHVCQKATTSFRGRDYTAWFAPDIPISNGPWKFGGLPGLIMQVTDSENHYDFELVGIENVSDPVRYYNTNFIKTTRSDLDKHYVRFHKDELNTLFIMALAQNPSLVPQVDPHSKEELPYNPIELE
jgi:GLPGLI family protein